MFIKKRKGNLAPLDITKIQKQTIDATAGLDGVSQSELELDAQIKFVDGMASSAVQDSLIKTAVEKIDIDVPNWTFVAARLFIFDLYHRVGNVIEGTKGSPYCHLSKYLKYGIENDRILPQLYDLYDLEELNSYIKPERDYLFNYLGIKTLYDRYLLKNSAGIPFELPQQMFMGIAMFLAQEEIEVGSKKEKTKILNKLGIKNAEENKEAYLKEVRGIYAKEFYDVLSQFEVMLATPTLSNARTHRHQLSSCFKKGTLVRTIEGYKAIDLLNTDDLVLTHKNRFMKVEELKERNYGSLLHTLKLNGYSNTLEATEEHPILSLKKEDIKCIRKHGYCIKHQGKESCLAKKGEYKDNCSLLEKEIEPKWIPIMFLEEGDFVSMSFPKDVWKDTLFVSDFIHDKNIIEIDNKIMYKRSSNSFFSEERSYLNEQTKPINNEIKLGKDFMLILGYFLAEGHINKSLTNITFTFASKEISYIKETLSIIKEIFGVEGTIFDNKDNSTSVMFHNKILSLFFYNLVGSGFDKKNLCKELLFADPEVQKYLLVGAFRGDGCAIEEGLQLTMSNNKLMKQLFEISLRCGYSPYLKENDKLSKLATVLASHLKINVSNDKEFILLVDKNLHKTKLEIKNIQNTKHFWYKGNYYLSIKLVEKTLLEDKVYNIEVEEDHSYSVNGVNVHNCYIGASADNIEGIFDAYKEMALLSKYGGGIGWDWTLIRGMASFIAGHKGAAGGTVPFLKITNDIAIAVDQLGTRKGAIAVYLEPWHADILDFLDLKKNSGEERRRTHDLFPALWITDLFMERVLADGTWTLFSPDNVPLLAENFGDAFKSLYESYEQDNSIPKQVISARELWKKAITQYFETGSPFLCFKDTANRANANQHVGHIRSSNLCVTGDTKLATQFGLVSAKELFERNQKIIASYDYRTNGDLTKFGVGVAECIEMYKTNENADIFEIKTKDGYSIKSTDWHEYYVSRDNNVIKIPLKDILLTDKLLIQSDVGQFGQEGSYDLGLLTGLIAGDGTFSEKKEYSIAHVDLYNKDIELKDIVLNSIKNVISKDYFKLDNAHKQDIDIKLPKEFKHTKNSSKIRFSSLRLGRVLNDLYDFNKHNKLRVPEFIFKGTKSTVKGYLQGLFISDACIEKIKNNGIPSFVVKLASKEKELLKDVQILLSNFGIRSKIYKSSREKTSFEYRTVKGEERKYKSSDLYLLSLNGNNAIKFINEIGLIGHKQEKALSIMSKRVSILGDYVSNKKEKFLVEISSISYVGKEAVYDTTQLLNHSLIFNGIVTGNCTEIFQNTNPNKYLIQIEFNDGEVVSYNENELILVDAGYKKQAKSITALDSINGKRIFIVDKEKIDGETAVCNLASVNLSRINTKEDIERVVPIAMRMLDNVIDLNFYPLRKVKATNLKSRAVGLGVMGESQMLAENKIHWGTLHHFNKIDEIMEAISYNAIKASAKLAVEKGSYPTFKGSNWNKGIVPMDHANKDCLALTKRELVYDWDELRKEASKGMRNGYLMANAPTSSISILVGTTQATEPIYKRKWYEENLSGLIPVVVPNLDAETWNYYTPASEVDQLDIIKAASVRQKWIDQGQSTNIFLTLEKATAKYLNQIYILAWKLGLKSTYYLRSQSADSKKAEMKSTDNIVKDNTNEDVMDRSLECEGCQ